MATRVTVSTSKPATHLCELAAKLSPCEQFFLGKWLRRGMRVVVFNIDGDTVRLANQPWPTGERITLAETERVAA